MALTAGCEKGAIWPGAADAVLGTGALAFVPMEDCGQVPIVHGLQGGFHVWGSVRLRYMQARGVRLELTILDGASGRTLAQPVVTKVDFTALDPGTLRAEGGASHRAVHCDENGDGGTADKAASLVPGGTDGWGESLGTQIFLPLMASDGGQVVPAIDGQIVTFHLEARDSDGRAASDEHTLTPNYRQ